MSSGAKYSTGTPMLVADDISLTDHAIQRWTERTPQDVDLSIHQAWQRGEWIKHPQVCQGDGHDEPPDRVRVYCDAGDWGVAYLVTESDNANIEGRVGHIVATINSLRGFDHGPSRAYLYSHGPHGGDER